MSKVLGKDTAISISSFESAGAIEVCWTSAMFAWVVTSSARFNRITKKEIAPVHLNIAKVRVNSTCGYKFFFDTVNSVLYKKNCAIIICN